MWVVVCSLDRLLGRRTRRRFGTATVRFLQCLGVVFGRSRKLNRSCCSGCTIVVDCGDGAGVWEDTTITTIDVVVAHHQVLIGCGKKGRRWSPPLTRQCGAFVARVFFTFGCRRCSSIISIHTIHHGRHGIGNGWQQRGTSRGVRWRLWLLWRRRMARHIDDDDDRSIDECYSRRGYVTVFSLVGWLVRRVVEKRKRPLFFVAVMSLQSNLRHRQTHGL